MNRSRFICGCPPVAWLHRIFGCGLACILLSSQALAEEDEVAVEESAQSDDIRANLLRYSDDRSLRLLPFMNQWDEAREKFNKTIGLSYSATYHAVGFASFLGDGVDGASSGDFTLQGAWAPGYHWTENPTQLRFRVRHRHRIGDTAASELSTQIGALWGVTDGFSNAGLEIPDFYFQHHFERLDFLLRYGQLTIDNQFDAHSLRGSKQSFLNQAFSSNPAVGFPRFGAGITMKKEWDNGIDLTLGISTVQGTQSGTQVDLEIGSGDLFEAVQVGYDFKVFDDRRARIQLLRWFSDGVADANIPSGNGLALTYEQELHDNGLTMFSRLAWSDGEATPLELFLAGGLGMPCKENDFVGIAAGCGRASSRGEDVQGVIEAFYRWQPRKGVRITPDIQILFGEGFNGSPGLRFLAGIRAEIAF